MGGQGQTEDPSLRVQGAGRSSSCPHESCAAQRTAPALPLCKSTHSQTRALHGCCSTQLAPQSELWPHRKGQREKRWGDSSTASPPPVALSPACDSGERGSPSPPGKSSPRHPELDEKERKDLLHFMFQSTNACQKTFVSTRRSVEGLG